MISGLIQLENKTCARAAQRKGDRADRGLVVPLVVLFSMVNLTSCPFFMFFLYGSTTLRKDTNSHIYIYISIECFSNVFVNRYFPLSLCHKFFPISYMTLSKVSKVSAPKAPHVPSWVTNRYFPTKFECVLMSRNVGPYRT